MMNHSEARTIAEAMWGTGGTQSRKTNRHGAFYFSCSGHGGFVIDALAFTAAERKALEPWAKPEPYELYIWGKHRRLWHPLRRLTLKFSQLARPTKGLYYVFEEDCDWALVWVYTKIRDKGHTWTDEKVEAYAKEVHARWHTKKETA